MTAHPIITIPRRSLMPLQAAISLELSEIIPIMAKLIKRQQFEKKRSLKKIILRSMISPKSFTFRCPLYVSALFGRVKLDMLILVHPPSAIIKWNWDWRTIMVRASFYQALHCQ